MTTKTEWSTQAEGVAYVAGVMELSDDLLDCAMIGVSCIGPTFNQETGKFDVVVTTLGDEDGDEDEDEDL